MLTGDKKLVYSHLLSTCPAVSGIGMGITLHSPFVWPNVALLLSAGRGSACDHVPWLLRRYHALILVSARMSLRPWRRTSKRRAQNARQVVLPKTIWIEIECGENDDSVTSQGQNGYLQKPLGVPCSPRIISIFGSSVPDV